MDEEIMEIFEYERSASRLELFVRIFYAIPVSIILFFYSIVASICLCLQWLVILIFGRRSQGLNGVIQGYTKYAVNLISYFSYLTDKRPGITPKNVKFYESILDE